MGFNPDGIDPHNLQLFGGQNGMLPQLNSAARIYDLRQVAMYEVGLTDGHFDHGDYLLFFGKGPDRYELDPATGTFTYENNLYTDKSYYFLTVGGTAGLRITEKADMAGTFPTVSEYDYFDIYENDQTSLLHSGRNWYGERFGSTLSYTVRFPIAGILPNSELKLITSVVGSSTGTSVFKFMINDVLVSSQSAPSIPGTPFTEVGTAVMDTVIVDASQVSAPTRTDQDVKISFSKEGVETASGYLDYVLIQARRSLVVPGNQFIFSSLKSLDQPVTRYVITSSSNVHVWDVVDPFEPVDQLFQSDPGGGTISFATSSTQLHTFVSFLLSNGAPVYEGEVPNQNLKGIGATDLLVISHPEFLSEATRFAAYRSGHSGIQVTVVTTDQVYNEFSGGKQDVTALRDLVKFLYDKGVGLKNVMLFGRGSYDYKNKLSFNKNFIPIYQSRNSLDPLATFASDDYLGFLETNEGNWREVSPVDLHTMEVGVGRIPVKKLEEATAWVNKVIAYETSNWGPWRKRILLTADDGDGNLHQSQAQQLSDSLESTHPEAEIRKLFLDAFDQIGVPNNQSSPAARNALTSAVSDGMGIINFTGHGSELQWMQEHILDQLSFDEWKPGKRFPFLVTATCEFGRHDDPGLISTAELSLFRANSGSIGLLTTARPVYSSTNFMLNRVFYQSLFTRSSGLFQDWGSVFRLTKNNSISGVYNRNFALLGDPSMLPPLGSAQVSIDNVTNMTSGSDTLKALSSVRIQGSVSQLGVPDNQYSGVVQLTLFNKRTTHVTKGDENPPFTYTLRDDALFRGNASVQAGQFEIEFIIPKEIDPAVNTGMIGLYVSPNGTDRDGLGSQTGIKVGAAEANTGTDITGPTIELFMGDTTFISGGLTGSSSRVIAILSDEHGIDISTFNPQNDILAKLDDGTAVSLNTYYRADLNNFKRGKVDYPVEGLTPGHHTLTLSATDTYGNTSSATIAFTVSDSPGIQIEQWLNYPNPFSTSTVFHFKHNRAGEDLEADVTIFDRLGRVVLSNTYQIGSSTYKVDLPPWDGTTPDGNKLTGGLYLMKLTVRSLLDGSKNERIAKVILLN